MRFQRLWLDSAIFVALTLLTLGVGWIAAPTIFDAAVRTSGVRTLSITSPTDVVAEHVSIVLALALSAPLAWLVGLVFRIAAHRAPSPWALAASWSLVIASALGGMIWMVYWMSDALEDEIALRPSLTPASFELGPSAIGLACRVSLVLAIAAFALGRRARRRS